MELYILRHGIAVERGSRGFEIDRQRPLTKEGEEKMMQTAKALLAMGLRFDLILSSRLVRARQTAEIVADELGEEITFSDHLAPGANALDLIHEINRKKPKRALLVGHEPDLSQLVSVMISG